MSLDIGFASQTPSLPGGGATLAGLGETFSPDLSTGTGTFAIPLDTPHGPNDIGPRLTLRYDTASPNGPFGLGWTLTLPRILRSTVTGRPAYDDTDTLVLEGSGPLVRGAGGTLRPQVDSGDWRVEAVGAGFVATDRSGTRFELGTTADARIDGPGGVPFAWLLHAIEDNLGERATVRWRADGRQRLLDSVTYGTYEVRFTWEDRPDPIRWAAGGILLATTKRCARVELRLAGAARPVARRWDLRYDRIDPNGLSVLAGVTLTGVGADGTELSAPPLTLGYTAAGTPRLVRVPAIDEACAPPGLDRARRVELVDWHGDGLPDVVEVAPGGLARVWRNEGGRWGRPRVVGEFAALASPLAGVGLIDVDGDGLADLVRVDRPAQGFQPRTADGAARPVRWRNAPSVALGDARARVADLDGDGRADLAWSAGGSLLLAARGDDGGWADRPVVASVPRLDGEDPPTALSDPHVHLADMSGDGSADLVRADGRGVRWWPHLGAGRFGEPVVMGGSPRLPSDVDPRRLHLVDLEGDGCADLLLVDDGAVTWWPNCAGDHFGAPRRVEHLPTGAMDEVRVADVLGTGAPALVFTRPTPAGRARWFALDLLGGTRPGVLTRIDNGIGLHTSVAYSTSSAEAGRDRTLGEPWPGRLPVVLTVVSAIEATDTASGRTDRLEYRYHDGRFDTVLRELAGFGRVDQDEVGDGDVPTLRTTRWFHNGTRPDGSEPSTTAERRRLRAVRGRVRGERRQTLDGHVFDETAWDWEVADDATDPRVVVPRQRRSARARFEGAATPASAIVTETVAWDAHGNVTEARERSLRADPLPSVAQPGARAGVEPSCAPADPPGGAMVPESTLHTVTTFAVDPSGRYRSRVARARQDDGTGTVLADSLTEYDGRPIGEVGAAGLVTARHALVLTDALAADVYGASLPDFAGLGYRRRAEAPGWWVQQARYTRAVDAQGVKGTITGPRGAVTSLRLDPTASQPAEVADPTGNLLRADYDPRVCRPVRLEDAAGAVTTATHDPLSRLVARHEPGDAPADPTLAVAYATNSVPVVVSTSRASGHPGEPRIVRRQFCDGAGRMLEQRVADAGGEVVEASTVFGPRGLPVRVHLPGPAAAAGYRAPLPATPHLAMRYDAAGRVVATTRPDGGVRTTDYQPGVVVERDEESNRTDPAAPHAGATTRRVHDAAGRTAVIEQSLDGVLVRAANDHAVRGTVVRHEAADGTTTHIVHDLLGRPIRVGRPERTQVSVLDAAGNTVELRSGSSRVFRTHDIANRLVAVRHGSAQSAPVLTCTYHDNGGPAPVDAGAHTAGGRLVAVDDAAGRTVYDYDERGRIARKAMTPKGGPTLELGLRHRPDGRIDAMDYPTLGAGSGPVVAYRYDRRGRLVSASGVIDAITWDDAGRRLEVRHANGVVESTPHDPSTGWCTGSTIAGPAGTLRRVDVGHDLVGNVLSLDSADPDLTWAYAYDEWHRLVSATGPAGTETYDWHDNGDLAGRSGVGAFTYGGAGQAPTVLTGAGADAYTWDDRGNMATAPWGTHQVDAEGRLVRIDLAGGGRHEFTYGHTGVLARQVVRDGGGAVVREVLRPDALVAVEDGVLVVSFTDGERIVARHAEGAGRLWHHHDHLGSLVLVTDAAAAAALSIRYGPWGEVLARSGPLAGDDRGEGFGGGVDALAGLVLLGHRWYCPRFGRFVSPDPLVADVDDPLAWNAYLYARGNPCSYTDASGKSFWKVFGAVLAAIAIVALIVVVSVLTFGVGTIGIGVFVAAMIGIAAGGVIGGIAAARAGGEWDDILLGVLVGGAVGGWAAFGAALAGPAVAGAFGLKGMFGGFVAGAVSGAINGAAMGFASGFAGGMNDDIGNILEKVLVGAVVGLVVGGAIGAVSGYTPSSNPGGSGAEGSAAGSAPGGGAAPAPGPGGGVGGAGAPAGPQFSDYGETAKYLGGEFAGYAGKQALERFGPGVLTAVAPYAASAIVQTVAVDLSAAGVSAFWDDIKEYVRTHDVSIGPIKGGGSF